MDQQRRPRLVRTPSWDLDSQSIQSASPSRQLDRAPSPRLEGIIRSLQQHLQSWQPGSVPHAMDLLDPAGDSEEHGLRSSEVLQETTRIWGLYELNRLDDEALAFLYLVEALEKERIQTILHHQARIANLEAELRSTTAKAASRDTPQHGSLDKGQLIEASQNEMQFLAKDIPELLLPSNLPTLQLQDQQTHHPITSRPKLGGETSRDMATRATHRHKDPSKFKFMCDKCEKSFTRSTTLQEHRRSHNNERRWACQLCPKRFVRLKDCNRHEALEHAQKKIECGRSLRSPRGAVWEWGCHQLFAREDGLISHLRTEKGRKCLQPLLANDDYSLFRMVDEVWVGSKFRCSQVSSSCQKEFDELGDFVQHLSAPAGTKCATSWIAHHVMKIYRGKSGASLVPSPSDVGEEQRPTPDPMDDRVQYRVQDGDEARRDREAPAPTKSSTLSTTALSTIKEDNIQPLSGILNAGDFRQRQNTDLVEPVARLPREPAADSPVSLASDPSDEVSLQEPNINTDWVVLKRSDTRAWFPGEIFWVAIKSSTRLEGKFLFAFGTHHSGATVAFEYSIPGSGPFVYKLSCEIPQVTFPSDDYHEQLEVRVFPSPDRRRLSRPICFAGWLFKSERLLIDLRK